MFRPILATNGLKFWPRGRPALRLSGDIDPAEKKSPALWLPHLSPLE